MNSVLLGVLVLIGSMWATAAAAPSGTMTPREAQIYILSAGQVCGPTYAPVANCPGYLGGEHRASVIVNSARYPGSTFRFEGSFFGSGETGVCIRLYDLTANISVNGSEMCRTPGFAAQVWRVRSGPLSLPAVPHEYTVEAKWLGTCTDCTSMGDARLIAN
jgi:hypothetical protein